MQRWSGIQLLNPRQIEAFRALMLTSSTVRAAEQLHVTQPAVSRLVKELQEAIGLALFERRGARLVPTSEAIALYGEVERSFVGLERIAEAAKSLKERRTGVLRVAAMPALCNGVLPRFAGEFLEGHPHVRFTLAGLVSHMVLDWVVNGQCDVGFAAAPVDHAAVENEKMPAVRYVAVVPKGHRLAARRALRPKDFAGQPFIALGPTTPSRFRIDDVFSRYGIARNIRAETPLSEIVCAMVASGLGVAIVDPFTAREYETRGVVARPFEPALDFQFAAVYPVHRSLSPVAREFIDAFFAYVKAWKP